jgi:hypothetical protein
MPTSWVALAQNRITILQPQKKKTIMNRKQLHSMLGALAVTALLVASPISLFGVQPVSSSQNSTDDVATVRDWLRHDDGGRYMITGFECTPERSADWPGYKSLPDGSLKRCTYSVTSCKNLKGNIKAICETNRKILGAKEASVVLLEPGLERFAHWIVSACIEVGGNRAHCLGKVYKAGRDASNWQIPIAGIVYEDMEPKYVQYGYAFRDGLTVRADAECGWHNGSAGERVPTAAENVACSRPEATPMGVSFMARPMSTTRTELIAWHPGLAAGIPPHNEATPIVGPSAEAWRQFVRDTLVSAFTSDQNPLVTAKAFALHQQGAF